MNGENSASASKTVILTAIVDRFDVELSQCRSTHDARLDRNVDVNFFEYGRGMFLQDLGDGLKLRMSCSLYTLAQSSKP